MAVVRMPSEGQRFKLKESTYQVAKSKGRRIVCTLAEGNIFVNRTKEMPKFRLRDTKFQITDIKEKRFVAVAI